MIIELNFTSDDLKENRNLLLAAVSNDSPILTYVHNERLLGDTDIIFVSIAFAVSSGGNTSLTVYYHFPRNNANFFLTPLKNN